MPNPEKTTGLADDLTFENGQPRSIQCAIKTHPKGSQTRRQIGFGLIDEARDVYAHLHGIQDQP